MTLIPQAGAVDAPLTAILSTSVHELQIVQMFHRVLELVINVSMILGPTFLILGAALYFLSGHQTRKVRGLQMVKGAFVLFFIVLGLESLIGLADWVVSV